MFIHGTIQLPYSSSTAKLAEHGGFVCCAGPLSDSEMRPPLRLARFFGLAKLQGIPISLIPHVDRRRLGFAPSRPRAFDFPPEARPGCHSGHVQCLGSFFPIKSSAIRAGHDSTLRRPDATRFLQTSVGRLQTNRLARGNRNCQAAMTGHGPFAIKRLNPLQIFQLRKIVTLCKKAFDCATRFPASMADFGPG